MVLAAILSILVDVGPGHCAGGGILPDWAPAWLVDIFLRGSQGIEVCGIEYVMLAVSAVVLVMLIAITSRMDRLASHARELRGGGSCPRR